MVRGSFLIISPDVIAFSLRISAFLCASAVGDLFYRRGAEERRDTQRKAKVRDIFPALI
jgi:hypothetical protein